MRSSVWAKLRSRNVLVLVDTAVAAGMSVILLMVAARSMSPGQLSDFSLLQLIAMTVAIIQRAFFLSPALTSQRRTGKSVIPIRWSVKISLPMAIITSGLIGTTIGLENGRFWYWSALGLAIGAATLVQDTLRFCLFSRGKVSGAVCSDACWLLLIAAVIIFPELSESADSLGFYWFFSGSVAVVIAFLWVAILRRDEGTRFVSMSHTWRLGKWSGVDALMSAAANLTPMVMTAMVLGSDQAGTYRVLQSALGPLNILSASLLTMFGLDAHLLVSKDSLNALRLRVRRVVVLMLGFAVAYLALAEVAIIIISDLQSQELVRIAIVVGVVGALGAATSPLAAAALALGYQKHGAILRIVIVTFSVGISILAGAGLPLPWNDPIGIVTLFAAAASLLGWAFSFRRALKLELKLVRAVSPAA